MKKVLISIVALVMLYTSQTFAQLYTNGGTVNTHSESTEFVGIGTHTPSQALTIQADHPRIHFESNINGNQGLNFTSNEGGGSMSFYKGRLFLNASAYTKAYAREGFRFLVRPEGVVYQEGSSAIPLSSAPLIITEDGKVGIGFNTIMPGIPQPTYEEKVPGEYNLYINGDMIAEKVVVKLRNHWADDVFEPEYTLTPLSEVEQFIKKHKHLPNVPSAKELKKTGLDMEKIQTIQMQKIEELTLYLIEMQKENEILKKKLQELETKINQKTHE